ncbi:MAG: hypothetical protein ACK55I_28880, partial [bacterium]
MGPCTGIEPVPCSKQGLAPIISWGAFVKASCPDSGLESPAKPPAFEGPTHGWLHSGHQFGSPHRPLSPA